MVNIPIVHATTKADYSGSGAVAANQELVAADWNQTHFTLSAGTNITIVSDGGTPPILTFASSPGLSGGTPNALPLWATSSTLSNSLIGQSGSTVSVGATLTPSLDNTY